MLISIAIGMTAHIAILEADQPDVLAPASDVNAVGSRAAARILQIVMLKHYL